MAIAFDALGTDQTDWTGTATASVAGDASARFAIAFAFCNSNGAGMASATCTYGGTSMTALQRADKATSFTMGGSVWFLDDISGGTQNCVFTLGSGSGRVYLACMTFTAAGACEVVASTTGINSDSSGDPHTYTLAMGSDTGYILAGHIMNNTTAADVAPLSGWGTDVAQEDTMGGNCVMPVYSRNSEGTGNITAGVSSTNTIEEIGLAIGVKESAAAGPTFTSGPTVQAIKGSTAEIEALVS